VRGTIARQSTPQYRIYYRYTNLILLFFTATIGFTFTLVLSNRSKFRIQNKLTIDFQRRESTCTNLMLLWPSVYTVPNQCPCHTYRYSTQVMASLARICHVNIYLHLLGALSRPQGRNEQHTCLRAGPAKMLLRAARQRTSYLLGRVTAHGDDEEDQRGRTRSKGEGGRSVAQNGAVRVAQVL